MQGRYEQQMKKGVLEMLVLKQLEKEERYGYQLISQLRDKSGGMFSLRKGRFIRFCTGLRMTGFW